RLCLCVSAIRTPAPPAPHGKGSHRTRVGIGVKERSAGGSYFGLIDVQLQQAFAVGVRRGCRPRGDIQLGEDAGDVSRDGADADVQSVRDLLIGTAVREQTEDFPLAR